MSQLTLEHVSAYLPWKVKVMRPDGKTMLPLIGIVDNIIIFKEENKEGYIYGDMVKNKLILRPLSDLTKPITVDGETFVLVDKLGWEFYNGEYGEIVHCIYGESPRIAINVLHYLDELKLILSCHFDIFNLIPQGLAIDINTLKK